MTLSGKKWLKILAEIYSRIMQGTPIIAILMILYYIIFGNSNISGTIVAIIGFGITSGAYLAQTFSGSISGIDKGQTEAALALGMTKRKAFMGIVMPQAIRRMLPGYFSQLISLIKGTSIVGYIAVVDLTKASDIIRSATFEAFFPILTSALIYFLISNLLLSVIRGSHINHRTIWHWEVHFASMYQHARNADIGSNICRRQRDYSKGL